MSHKNIPCPKCNRIWMWLEHATPEFPVCPKGYGCNDIKKDISEIEILERILNRLDKIEKKITENHIPSYPNSVNSNSVTCEKCGIEWKGVMNYSCPRLDCPTQTKTICNSFDVEDPDPAKRTWVYDGFGIPRKKQSMKNDRKIW